MLPNLEHLKKKYQLHVYMNPNRASLSQLLTKVKTNGIGYRKLFKLICYAF